MQIIKYVKIQNFKKFGDIDKIELEHPSVLVGPNNSGKTSILQALALWNTGIRLWYESKGAGKSKKRLGTSINRLSITQVPIQEAKFFWNNISVKTGKGNTELKITVGLEFNGEIKECSIVFTYFNAESIYCFPDESTLAVDGLLAHANTLNVKILYPMSGIVREEPYIAEGRIESLIGQGQTSEILRNLCYKVIENDKQHATNDWQNVENLMQKLFGIVLKKPVFNVTRGIIELAYQVNGTSNKKIELDIASSGRGQQEILLLIAYIYTHKKTVLLLDEPDAHLEILRQKQVFNLLQSLAKANDCQLIIATHSEVILNEASEENLTLLIDGQVQNIQNDLKKSIKSSLKEFGFEHYLKAKIAQSVFYVEGGTDIKILAQFAKKLKHQVAGILENDSLNVFYTQNNISNEDIYNQLDKDSGAFENPKKHFQAVSSCVAGLRGIGIFDGDGKGKNEEIKDNLKLQYWKKYEIENYFTYPYVLRNFTLDNTQLSEIEIEEVLNETILEELLSGDINAFDDYQASGPALQKRQFQSLLNPKKASGFIDKYFQKLSVKHKIKIFLNKGSFYELVSFVEESDIDVEVTEKLNILAEVIIP